MDTPSLDLATCTIIQRRARYTPARDEQGRAVADRAVGRIRWVLPINPPTRFVDYRVAMVFTANAAGEIGKCRIDSNVVPLPPTRNCAGMIPMGRKVAANGKGRLNLHRRELVLEEGLRIGAPDAAQKIGHGAGEVLAMLTAMALEIDAAGKIARCSAADGNMKAQGAEMGCRLSAKRTFVALDPVASSRLDRHAVQYLAAYTRPVR